MTDGSIGVAGAASTKDRAAKGAPVHFATLTFERQVKAPLDALWQALTAPAARALWASPSPDVTVTFLEADSREGAREVSLCQVEGQPDLRCDVTWLALQPPRLAINAERVSCEDRLLSTALVTTELKAEAGGAKLQVTVQLAALSAGMEDGYRQGFSAGLDQLAGVAVRTMLIERIIAAPRERVWAAWMNEETLPSWWGPNGFSCRTTRIDLRSGGEWVFDMIGPDGTVYPNHHRYHAVVPQERFAYSLHWGENGPKHADAWAAFEAVEGGTRVRLAMVFSSIEEFETAKGFGAPELGQETLAKLEAFVSEH